MNRGRHKSSKTSEVVKLAGRYGAHYPAAWENNISYENLIKLIDTQKEKCGFNNLHIFETNYSSSDITRGGFNWYTTEEDYVFWSKCLSRLYNGIRCYIIKQTQTTIKIKLK